jgi:hypothetical protein
VYYNRKGKADGDYQACFVASLAVDAAGHIEVRMSSAAAVWTQAFHMKPSCQSVL